MRLLSKFITDYGKFSHHIGTLKTVGFLLMMLMHKITVFFTFKEVVMVATMRVDCSLCSPEF